MAQSIVYVHGVPHSGAMWRPFTDRTGGVAPDLPGFGASAKPSSGDYTFGGLARWLSDYTREMESFSLVMHDWGSLGVLSALERPEAVERLVLIDAVPFLPGYRWHTVARIWRTPVIGELAMGLTTKWGLGRLARMQARTPLPDTFEQTLDEVWQYFDHGTQRAILRLYRSAPEPVLAESGRGLGTLKAPALVVWGAEDPYLPAEFGHRYADALGGPTETEIVPGAGHWPWFEQPAVIDRVAQFLAG